MNLAGAVIQCAIHAQLLVGPGSRHFSPLPAEAPDLRQRGMQVNLGFVKEQQVEVVLGFERAFFKNPMISFFSLYCCGSRRCPMT